MPKITAIDNVDFKIFKPSKPTKHNKTDFSIRMIYENNEPLTIETEPLVIVIKLLKYRNPHENYDSYSMAIAIPEAKDEQGQYKSKFARFVHAIDDAAKRFRPANLTENDMKDYVFESPIRNKHKDNHDDHLRVKIDSDDTTLFFEYYLDKYDKIDSTSMSEKQAKKLFVHGTPARFQLQFKKIWFSTTAEGVKKYGYSWGLHAMQVHRQGFSASNENNK